MLFKVGEEVIVDGITVRVDKVIDESTTRCWWTDDFGTRQFGTYSNDQIKTLQQAMDEHIKAAVEIGKEAKKKMDMDPLD
jgi:hypothetical protein